jgi:AcrR family transcriptional regulator
LNGRLVKNKMSPRTAKQYEEIREEKKNLIMDVALEHFANEGFHATTINLIAKHAGISKGLMYNYFDSKESLLSGIMTRSVSQIVTYFDINKDGYLTEEEFEFFLMKVCRMLKEKKSFWRLFFQLLMQNEVREQFLNTFLDSRSLFQAAKEDDGKLSVSSIMKIIGDYFIRKKERKGTDYDPYLDLNMFIITMKGFAITYIYMEPEDDITFNKTVNRIIEQYK